MIFRFQGNHAQGNIFRKNGILFIVITIYFARSCEPQHLPRLLFVISIFTTISLPIKQFQIRTSGYSQSDCQEGTAPIQNKNKSSKLVDAF